MQIKWLSNFSSQIEKRSKLGESQTLQQFSRDADEIENWMLEKLQLAEEETYKDPANIQSKHQKHQAFEAELGANADRIQSVLAMGQNLVNIITKYTKVSRYWDGPNNKTPLPSFVIGQD